MNNAASILLLGDYERCVFYVSFVKKNLVIVIAIITITIIVTKIIIIVIITTYIPLIMIMIMIMIMISIIHCRLYMCMYVTENDSYFWHIKISSNTYIASFSTTITISSDDDEDDDDDNDNKEEGNDFEKGSNCSESFVDSTIPCILLTVLDDVRSVKVFKVSE